MGSLTGVIRATFGFADFRPGQAEAIESRAAGEHTLVVMPTGAGKSLVYQMLAITSPGVTLVISPLISLMQDQTDSLARLRIPATYINSSISASEQSRRLRPHPAAPWSATPARRSAGGAQTGRWPWTLEACPGWAWSSSCL